MRAPSTFAATDDPSWLPHRFDPQRDAIHFVFADRTERRSIPFLTDEYLSAAATPRIVARATARTTAAAAAPVHFIFHAAYCCSTLVAAALDRSSLASSLKEPVLLNDLVGWRHRGATDGQVERALDDGLTLLARPFEPGEAVVVKPSNVVNALAPAMLRLRPTARALLLYAPLPVYLASIARKGLWGRVWVRDLFVKQLADGLIDLGFRPDDYLKLTDLQIAAVGWLAQIDLFAKLRSAFPERTRTLDSETLMARPDVALVALGGLYGLAVDAATASDIADGPIFRRDAKSGATYDARDRQAAQASGKALHAEEIDKVVTWIAAVARSAGVAMVPDGGLLD